MSDQERRQQRSDDQQEALTFQLQHVRETYGIERIAFVAEDGTFIGGSDDQALDMVAGAFGHEIVRSDSADRRDQLTNRLFGLLDCDDNQKVELCDFEINGHPAFICAVAPSDVNIGRAVDHSVQGFRRISATL